jgi:coenzyme F420-0:L-glutamate ligase / coenzyme F420-1:gamma-L-glutamate ligase
VNCNKANPLHEEVIDHWNRPLLASIPPFFSNGRQLADVRQDLYSFVMQIFGVTTSVLCAGYSLAEVLRETVRDGDIVVLSSKAVAAVEGIAMNLASLPVSPEAALWATRTGRSVGFCEAVLRETMRMHGKAVTYCPGVILTQLKPDGMHDGVLLVPNAGLDESNIDHGFAIGWPHDPVKSVRDLRTAIGKEAAYILTDSCILPRRKGVLAFALACTGINPLKSEIGKQDLFGKTLSMTVEASADQLAVAGNFIMGNASQATPAAIIRDHGIPLAGYEGWVDGIDPAADLFRDIFQSRLAP